VNARATLSNGSVIKENCAGTFVVRAIQDSFEVVLEKEVWEVQRKAAAAA
jgi:hypothetical protein